MAWFAPSFARAARVGARVACPLMLLLAGCTPELNWRDVRVEPQASGLVGLWPCKPDRVQREVPLAGQTVTMSVHSCAAAGVVFAVSVARLADPAQVPVSLRSLAEGAHRNLDVPLLSDPQPFMPAGSTPQPGAGRWVLRPTPGESRVRTAQMAVFARGPWVFQALVVGPAELLAPAVADSFLDSLRFNS